MCWIDTYANFRQKGSYSHTPYRYRPHTKVPIIRAMMKREPLICAYIYILGGCYQTRETCIGCRGPARFLPMGLAAGLAKTSFSTGSLSGS